MDSKLKIHLLKHFQKFSSSVEEKEEEVKEEVVLADEAEEAKEKVEEAVEAYVTMSQFNALKEDNKKFMETVSQMLSDAMEMLTATEKNTVPVEASEEKEEEVVEVVDAPEIELSEEKEEFVHVPGEVEKKQPAMFKVGAGAPKTLGDRVRETWYNSLKK